MKEFKKRHYQSVGQLLSEVGKLARRPKLFFEVASGRGALDPAFREKIMLAVTSVNRCRYCSFVHTLIALREGSSLAEIQDLLRGMVDDVEEEEREALLYAQHWADTGGHPDQEARERLLEAYGPERAEAMEAAIQAIMIGNYFGNTVDMVLHRISGGRLAASER